MIGVDYELFWTLNPKSLNPFIKAFELSQKEKDRESWRLGDYIRIAIASNFSKEVKYPEQPLSSVRVKTQEELNQELLEKVKARAIEINKKFEG